MKLNKDQIKFIDDYLIKNKVKFWDVRFELLDHIICEIENKMNNSIISFDEALLQTHKSFGNSIEKYRLNKDNSAMILEKGIYFNNEGFKNIQLKKQKEINRKFRKSYWKCFVGLFKSLNFYLEYIIAIISIIIVSEHSLKTAFIIASITLFYPYLIMIYYGIKEKFIKYSLNMNLVGFSGILFFSVYSLMLNISNMYYEDGSKPFFSYIILCVILFPFVRASIKLYQNVFIEFKSYYKLVNL